MNLTSTGEPNAMTVRAIWSRTLSNGLPVLDWRAPAEACSRPEAHQCLTIRRANGSCGLLTVGAGEFNQRSVVHISQERVVARFPPPLPRDPADVDLRRRRLPATSATSCRRLRRPPTIRVHPAHGHGATSVCISVDNYVRGIALINSADVSRLSGGAQSRRWAPRSVGAVAPSRTSGAPSRAASAVWSSGCSWDWRSAVSRRW